MLRRPLVTTCSLSVLTRSLGKCDLWPLSFLVSCQVGGSPLQVEEVLLGPPPWSPGPPTGGTLCVMCQSLSRVRLFATPRTVARQAPLSMGFSRQDYWSGHPASVQILLVGWRVPVSPRNCVLKENVLSAGPLTRPVAAGSQSVGRASLHVGAPTNLSWAPLPLPLLKEGICLPCPLLLQAHRSLNPELSGRSLDSPGPHLILQGI